MSVREVAAAAWADKAQRLDEEQKAQEQAERDRLARRQERAGAVLDYSPLSRWFPDATFNIINYTSVGTSLQYQSDGTDIIVRSDDGVLFALSYVSPAEVHVYCVELIGGSGSEAYYSGPRVESVEDVGKVLSQRKSP